VRKLSKILCGLGAIFRCRLLNLLRRFIVDALELGPSDITSFEKVLQAATLECHAHEAMHRAQGVGRSNRSAPTNRFNEIGGYPLAALIGL
jgi:hypothetical protein